MFLLFSAVMAAAQDRPVTEGEVEFQDEIDVRLVQVPILARDRLNRPVTDLSPDEIVIKDRGREVAVAFFEPFFSDDDQTPLPDVRLQVDLPGTGEPVSSGDSEPRHVVFYVDVENDQPLGKMRAAQDLIDFVIEDLDPSYRAAVLSFHGEIELHQGFTADRMAITRAIREAFDRPPRPQVDLRARVRQLIDRFDDCLEDDAAGALIRDGDETCLRAVALHHADEVRPRSTDFLRGLEALVRFTGGLDGRKTVIAVSHGTAVEPVDEIVEAMRAIYGDSPLLGALRLELLGGEGARRELDEVLDLAVRNQVTLHFVDRTSPPTGDFGASLGTPYQPGARPMLAAYTAPQTDLREIAATTGGVFVASTDLLDGVRQAMAVERGGYVLGYYADVAMPRDRLAKVSVSCRRRGVEISHRRGTYVQPPGAAAPFRGRILLGRPQRLPSDREEGLHVPFRVVADPRDLGYALQGDAMASNFTLQVTVEQGDRRLASSYHFVEHAYPRELWDAGDVEPVTVDGWVEVPVGSYRLVASFRNARTGDGGRLSQEVSVASRGEDRAAAGPGS